MTQNPKWYPGLGRHPKDFEESRKRKAAIVAMRRSGKTLKAVGDAFGISGQQVRNIVIRCERKEEYEKRRNRPL